ncbi:hypothetical protein D9599_27245 [Roseomonas sp. KE2513]|uniref:amidohydrolase family protein n=1 Tax=Roseomonas sp. KE2513 TaxID=2479202 RepID=UPI0021042D09|nr:amidohydrolase family protein [Roseomonas sp. KE2513]MBI0539231.1 hypothetical protein [Roseomonas sp. KE2513]
MRPATFPVRPEPSRPPRRLIRCGWLITMDGAAGAVRDSEILVEGDRIAAVGHRLHATAEAVIDASRMIVMPGLVNMHLHTFQAGFRAVGSEWSAAGYFRHLYGNASTRFTPEDNFLGTYFGALNQLNQGVTTLFDYCHNIRSLEQAERSIDALEESGIRAVFALGRGIEAPERGGERPGARQLPRDWVSSLRRGRLGDDQARVTMALGIAGPHWSDWDTTLANFRLARDFGLISSSHVTRAHAEGQVPDGYDRLAALGLLGPSHNLVHCNRLSVIEIARLVETGASITTTNSNELHDYPGHPATWRVIQAGGLPSTGIDVEAMVSGDFWREMQTALLHARHEALVEARETPPSIPLRSRDALRWATEAGARALGMEGRIGKIAPGAKADIIMLRADDLNLLPVHDPILAVVEQAHSGNVDAVLVDGVLRKSGGALLDDQTLRTQRGRDLQASVARLVREAASTNQWRLQPDQPSSRTMHT